MHPVSLRSALEVRVCERLTLQVKERNGLVCIYRLEIDLQCGTYSTEDALLPLVVEAALEG